MIESLPKEENPFGDNFNFHKLTVMKRHEGLSLLMRFDYSGDNVDYPFLAGVLMQLEGAINSLIDKHDKLYKEYESRIKELSIKNTKNAEPKVKENSCDCKCGCPCSPYGFSINKDID